MGLVAYISFGLSIRLMSLRHARLDHARQSRPLEAAEGEYKQFVTRTKAREAETLEWSSVSVLGRRIAMEGTQKYTMPAKMLHLHERLRKSDEMGSGSAAKDVFGRTDWTCQAFLMRSR